MRSTGEVGFHTVLLIWLGADEMVTHDLELADAATATGMAVFAPRSGAGVIRPP